jgi:hypothetical protein
VRGAVTALDIAFLLAWVWSVGSFLSFVVRPSLRLNMPLFYFTLTFPLLYAALSFVLNEHSPLAMVKIALRVLAVVCTMYDVGFVAESLVRAETDKPASFTEVAIQFVLIWFFVFGVWSVQPRINRLYAERTKGSTPDQPVRQGAIQSPG